MQSLCRSCFPLLDQTCIPSVWPLEPKLNVLVKPLAGTMKRHGTMGDHLWSQQAISATVTLLYSIEYPEWDPKRIMKPKFWPKITAYACECYLCVTLNPAGMTHLPEVASLIEVTKVCFQLTTSRLSHCWLIPTGAALPLPTCGAAELLFPIAQTTNRHIICTTAPGEQRQPPVSTGSLGRSGVKTKTDRVKSLNVFLPCILHCCTIISPISCNWRGVSQEPLRFYVVFCRKMLL